MASLSGRSGGEVLGVVLDVIVHEGEDEEVAVVVALQEETQQMNTTTSLKKTFSPHLNQKSVNCNQHFR